MSKKQFSLLTVLLIAVLTLNILSGGATAYAAAETGIVFDCVYDTTYSTLTVTASVSNPQTAVNTAMFMLDYNTDILTANVNSIEFLGNATKSETYFSAGHIGADWYYSEGLPKSSQQTDAVKLLFTVKNGTQLSDVKNALSVCDHSSFLNECGGYGGDGGVLLCVNSSEYYNITNNTASAAFDYAQIEPEKPKLSFHSVFSAADGTLTTTVSVVNPQTKVGSAMFVISYDSSKLSVSADNVSFLNGAKKSAVYSQSPYVGADWYYDTALLASSSPSQAIRIVFNVLDGVDYEDLKNNSPLSVCTDTSYIGSLGYEKEGGLLICVDGTTDFSHSAGTVEAVFTYERTAEPTTPTTSNTTSPTTTTTSATKTTSTTKNEYNKDPSTGDNDKGSTAALILICFCAAILTAITYSKYRSKTIDR